MNSMKVFALMTMLVSAPPAWADWDGVDQDTGNSIAIEPGNLVRDGNDIEVYDYNTGQYRNLTVEDIERSGSDVEIDYYDNETGESGTLEMED
jgi:hypothetical protein